MRHVRRFIGLTLILAGIVGLGLSLTSIYGVYETAPAMSRQSADILDSTREAVVFLKRGTTRTQGLLAETKARTTALEATMDDIAAVVKDAPSKKAFLDKLDNNISKQLLRAQSTLASLQSTLEGFHNMLALFNALEGFSKPKSDKYQQKIDMAQDLSRSLTEASENLNQISGFLNDVLTDREITLKGLTEARGWVSQVQGRLIESEQQVDAFQTRLTVTDERIQASQKTIPTWIDRGGLFAIVLLACFAFTQLGLILQGVSMCRKGANALPPANA